MDKYEARRQAVQRIIDDRCQGNQSDFARVVGINASYVSRMLFPPGKDGAKRIGDDLAEKIEIAFGLPYGSLSQGATHQATYIPTSPEESLLIQAFRLASAESRKIMLMIAKSVLEKKEQSALESGNGIKKAI